MGSGEHLSIRKYDVRQTHVNPTALECRLIHRMVTTASANRFGSGGSVQHSRSPMKANPAPIRSKARSMPAQDRLRSVQRYHPMLHSKVYFFEMHDGTASAFVGSHNVTGFALRGLNGEAGVLLEGLGSDPTFAEVQQHINQAYLQAAAYDSSMKEAY